MPKMQIITILCWQRCTCLCSLCAAYCVSCMQLYEHSCIKKKQKNILQSPSVHVITTVLHSDFSYQRTYVIAGFFVDIYFCVYSVGNAILWQGQVRLCHMTTRKYLSVTPGGEIALTDESQSPATVFRLHPVIKASVASRR